jgi:hypothetical protein
VLTLGVFWEHLPYVTDLLVCKWGNYAIVVAVIIAKAGFDKELFPDQSLILGAFFG